MTYSPRAIRSQNPATRRSCSLRRSEKKPKQLENMGAEYGPQTSQFSYRFPFLHSSVVSFLEERGCWKTEREDDKHCCGII